MNNIGSTFRKLAAILGTDIKTPAGANRSDLKRLYELMAHRGRIAMKDKSQSDSAKEQARMAAWISTPGKNTADRSAAANDSGNKKDSSPVKGNASVGAVKSAAPIVMGSIVPGFRPKTGPMANRNVYSDAGRFFSYTHPSGRKSTIYLRNNSNPNLAVMTPGRWSSGDVRNLVQTMFSSPHLASGNNIIGVTRDQAFREILSHDNMDSEGGSRRGIFSNPIGFTSRIIGGLLKDEKDPAAVTDMRGLPKNPTFKQSIEQLGHGVNSGVVMMDEGIRDGIAALKRRMNMLRDFLTGRDRVADSKPL